MPAFAVLHKEKSIVSCLSTCNYGTVLSTTVHFLSGPPPCCCFLLPFIDGLTFFIFTHPPYFLLYLHLYFTPSLSCCLSVMWSRTDAGSPNCGTAISALLWLLGSLSETGLGDAPPSPSASKKERGEWQSWPSGHQPKFRWSLKISQFSERAASHLQCSRAYCGPGGALGEYGFVEKTQGLNHRTVWQISTVMLPTFWYACDGKSCVQILCHHA